MVNHEVKFWRSPERWKRQVELAYKIVEVSADDAPVEPEVVSVINDCIIDNQGATGIDRRQVMAMCAQAETRPHTKGVRLIGVPERGFHSAWVGLASAVSVQELELDNFFGTELGHSGETIAPILALAQNMHCAGLDLARAVETSYVMKSRLITARGSASSSITSIMSAIWHRSCCRHWRDTQANHGGV